MKVEQFELDARRLITIELNSPIWTDASVHAHRDVEGCIVRVKPPSTVTPEDIERVLAELRQCGAVAVRLLPQERGVALPASAKAATPTKATAREVILEMVDEVRTDQDALRELVETTMDLEGM